ncbi:MAG: pantetheine-phosphate adenylyltransferase [Flavobacteriaceae bacterium]|nr:pantetheine-phosphate adenylyltransferase [Flavobacteriaceae bacterium]
MRRAVFPGSFDPITLGHQDIILRAIPLFDEIIIAIGINHAKKYMFSMEQRMEFVRNTFKDEPSIKVEQYEGLTVDYCQAIGADYMLRGLRNPADFEFEKAIAQTNRKLSGIDTVFFLTSAEISYISSSIVREVVRNNGDYTTLVPESVRVE